ncbi:MAG: fumarylacetoacetate hydrolase family protein [Flavobacteriales bacterium]|nr:fumarylacetoacetate hydrolase family protein [Flavobacteriales bacterium]
MTTEILIAAEILWNAEKYHTPCPPIREIIGGENQELAYQVQQINVRKKIENGSRIVGKKIGLTSFAVQKQLGVNQPDFGMLFHDTQIVNGVEVLMKDLMQPKAEAEIAFVLKNDLTKDFTLENLIESIDYCCASIEIVGSRIENWNIKITDTIADNASASHFILGEKKLPLSEIDLVNCKMKLFKNGELASEGNGKACMDNPLNAALWLAEVMAKNGTPLQKGEILLSGALGPMVSFEKGDEILAEIDGFDAVSFRVK